MKLLRNIFRYLLLCSCSFSCAVSSSTAFAEDPSIGATLPLTGNLAFIGQAQANGIRLAVDKINRDGGIGSKTLRLVLEDNAGDPKLAVSGVIKLLDADRVTILFSSMTHITQAVKSVASSRHAVMLYAAALGSIAAENPRFFRDWGDAGSEGEMLAKAMLSEGKRRVAFLGETNDACVEVSTRAHAVLAAEKVVITEEMSFNPGETDFRSMLLKLSKGRPEALLVCAWRDAGRLMTQLKESGLIGLQTYHLLAPFLPINDTSAIRSLYEENHARSAWLGLVPGVKASSSKEFIESFEKAYGSPPRSEAGFAYDDTMVIAQALRFCASVARPEERAECITKELAKTSYEGVSGRLSFDASRRSNRVDSVIEVKGGAWREVYVQPGS